MPYVEVWVDEADCDCDDAELERLEAVIKEAADHIRAGYFDAALHALTQDCSLPVKRPEEIARKYKEWKKGKLHGFLPPASVGKGAEQ